MNTLHNFAEKKPRCLFLFKYFCFNLYWHVTFAPLSVSLSLSVAVSLAPGSSFSWKGGREILTGAIYPILLPAYTRPLLKKKKM